MDVDALDPVRLHVLEAEPREVAGARADAAQGVLGYTLHRESANELRVVPKIVGDSHVFDARVVGSGQNHEEVEVLRVAGHRVARVLERAQLHLGLQGVRRELAPVAWMLQIGAFAEQIVGVPEGDEGTE